MTLCVCVCVSTRVHVASDASNFIITRSFLCSQSCPRCCGPWWCAWGCGWTPLWGFCSWYPCSACSPFSLCPSSWWWRDCLHSFMPSGCTGKMTENVKVRLSSASNRLIVVCSQQLFVSSSGWSFRINSTVGLESSSARLPSLSCPPASNTTAYCEETYLETLFGASWW